MTVCIGALSDSRKAIVTASDQMVSTDSFSADELMVKLVHVHENWSVMLAADDISIAASVIDRAHSKLPGCPLTVAQVSQAFSGAFQDELRERANDRILSRLGLDMDAFISKGFKALGPSEFARLREQISAISLGCDLLIVGFDKFGSPHIVAVSDPGEPHVHDPYGLWAIGSGANSALGILFFHHHNAGFSLPLSVYHVCEAKFMAESAPGVGKETFVCVYTCDYDKLESGDAKFVSRRYLTSKEVAEIRSLWESTGKPKAHYLAEGKISEMLNDASFTAGSLSELMPIVKRRLGMKAD